MWDEKKFFKDYVEEAERIKPDGAFLEQLKNKTNQDNMLRLKKSMEKRRKMQYIAVAASIFLCISIGGIGWSVFGRKIANQGQDHASYQGEVNAGKEEQEVQSGTIEETNSVLLDIISMVEDENNLLDNQQGDSLSTQEREKLVEMLKKSKKIESSVDKSAIDFSKEGEVYYCVSDETVKITIYEDKYIVIADVVYVVTQE